MQVDIFLDEVFADTLASLLILYGNGTNGQVQPTDVQGSLRVGTQGLVPGSIVPPG